MLSVAQQERIKLSQQLQTHDLIEGYSALAINLSVI